MSNTTDAQPVFDVDVTSHGEFPGAADEFSEHRALDFRRP